jgi:serine/threonine protein kinase
MFRPARLSSPLRQCYVAVTAGTQQPPPPNVLLCCVPLLCVYHCCRFPQFSPASLAKLIPSGSPEAIDLIAKLIAWNPDSRLSSEQALRHPYFAVSYAC